MPRLLLPPLPRASLWPKYISRTTSQSPTSSLFRKMENRRRVLLTSRAITDDFVRALGIREGEVVVEAYCGMGRLTRSLVAGGWDETTWEDWRSQNNVGVQETEINDKSEISKNGQTGAGSKPFPLWSMDELEPASPPPTTSSTPTVPKIVVASDPSTGYLNRGLGEIPESLDPLDALPTPPPPHHHPSSDPSHSSSSSFSSSPSSSSSSASTFSLGDTDSSIDMSIPDSLSSDEASEIDSSLTSLASQISAAYTPPVHIKPSAIQPGLFVSHSSPYPWTTVPRILSHPLVTPHLPLNPRAQAESQTSLSMSDNNGISTSTSGSVNNIHLNEKANVEATKRRWSDPEPPITLVAQLMDSVLGEQMVAQWVGSVVGTDEKRSWIWQWGRVRMALLVGRGLYDRLMARPGERIHCKLSVMANALFHLSPLPPYHHVPNVDKRSSDTHLVLPEPKKSSTSSSSSTGTSKKKRRRHSIASSNYLPSLVPANTAYLEDLKHQQQPAPSPLVTTTYAHDFFGLPRRNSSSNSLSTSTTSPSTFSKENNHPLARPVTLGVLFIPRLDSPITPEQKESWDYVLRKCFVTEASTLQQALRTVAFGAENLLPQIEDGSGEEKLKGEAVPGDTIVRDMTVEQWTRVVDVFDKWPFKPENLVLDSFLAEESREVGTD